MRRMRRNRAFTLIELMVVMGIAAALVAITVPVARNLANTNKGLRCATRMQRINQALKMYVLDEGCVPPYYPDPAGTGAYFGPGLQALFESGYLSGESSLHCPADSKHPEGDPLFSFSYMNLDDDAMCDGSTEYGVENQSKYLTSRGLRRDSADPDVRRQLAPLPPSPSTSLIPEFSREWHPDDTTVVTWCNYHALTITKGGEGQYQVLFWDGSVHRMDATLLQDGVDVAEAWRIKPSDDPVP